MGKKKINIEKIENTNKRMVSFSKRRGGLRSKAAELRKLCADIGACLIVFSPAGKAYTFSNSPVGVCNMVNENKNVRRCKNSTQCKNKNGVGSGSDSFWWDDIEIEELDSVEKVKKEKLTAATSSPLTVSSLTIEDSIIEDRIVEDTATTITEKLEAGWTC
ncbi:hypothetical protein MKX03_020968 [Papaver bracteatum]|nr:hypothetical protein MKX03_020968 [Papaver bracteatum]